MTPLQIADALLQELSDRGQIVEGGWRAYELLTGIKDASEVQRTECRKAFFLGTQHTFSCMFRMMDTKSGSEPSDLEMDRMKKLAAELKQFVEQNCLSNQ